MKPLSFRGGIHPPDNKHLTREKPIEDLPLPDKVFIPLSQHAGAPAEALVKEGDTVRKWQKIGESKGFISSPVHASVAGEVAGITVHPHPVLGSAETVVIQRVEEDGEDGPPAGDRSPDLPPDELKSVIREAGIVGMGGACFPAAVKLSPPEHARIDTLIINGAECEPYITSDYRLMLEAPGKIVSGAGMLMRALGVRRCLIAIEDNKPACIAAMKKAAAGKDGMEVLTLAAKYPQGGEKQLIKAVLGREVPSGGLPLEVGVVVHNVGTAFAVREAVEEGKPLVERIVTVSGENLNNPKNLRVRIGTPFSSLIEFCGGLREPGGKLIAGGPMMGIAQYSFEAPVIKGTSGLLSFPPPAGRERSYNCIRCGSCADACPVNLIPADLARYSEREMWQEAKRSGLNDCMECGSCSYVCPARIHIVHLVKDAKVKCRDI